LLQHRQDPSSSSSSSSSDAATQTRSFLHLIWSAANFQGWSLSACMWDWCPILWYYNLSSLPIGVGYPLPILFAVNAYIVLSFVGCLYFSLEDYKWMLSFSSCNIRYTTAFENNRLLRVCSTDWEHWQLGSSPNNSAK
jgi:hypothetical protein